MTRVAECRCGKLTARCEGEPARVSVCHCLDCKRRSGSAFAAQVRFPVERVTIAGASKSFVRTADSGNRITHRFCADCASEIAYQIEDQPDIVAVPLGAFADPDFAPSPAFSVYEARKCGWVAILGDVDHLD